jgi:hypothetical protein
LNLNSISQLFHLLAHSVESEIIRPTFPSACSFGLSLKFIRPKFFICLLIWASLKFIQLTFSSAHWVESESIQLTFSSAHSIESEFIQLTFSSAHSVESELGLELMGWWTAWLSSNLGFELTWQPAQLRLRLIRV